MATITSAKLTIEHDHKKKLAHVKVKTKIRFSELELCQMRVCPEARIFKLKCQLWGDDWPDPDDLLYTLDTVYYFPDGDPTANESRTFKVTLAVQDFVAQETAAAEVVNVEVQVNDGVIDIDVVVASPGASPEVDELAAHLAEELDAPVQLSVQTVATEAEGATIVEP